VRLLRGREAVRADRRLCADEKHIRTQSAILNKTPNTVFGVNRNRAYCTDVLFIRTVSTVGARSAQVLRCKDYAEIETELIQTWN
jgi:hypothetical protein